MKKLLAILLAFAMLISTSVVSFSAKTADGDGGISVQGVYVGNVNSYLTISSKTATCTSKVLCELGTTHAVVTQYLQKLVNGSWTNVVSWSKTFYEKSITYKNTKKSLSSGTYRVYTVAKVYMGSAYETGTKASTSVKI